MSIVQKLKELMAKHGDKAGPAIDKAGDMIDRRTGGKYSAQVDEAQRRAKEVAAEQARRHRRSQ